MNNLHAVIDIETLSLKTNAMIATIGAVMVDQEKLEIVSEIDIAFDMGTVERCHPGKFHIDPDTFVWWLQQSQQAREALQNGLHTLYSGMDLLSEWFLSHGGGHRHIWGNGPQFDVVCLEHAFGACHIATPWDYHRVRDIRTMCETFGVKWKDHLEPGTAHDALFDARAEANGLIECFRIEQSLRS